MIGELVTSISQTLASKELGAKLHITYPRLKIPDFHFIENRAFVNRVIQTIEIYESINSQS